MPNDGEMQPSEDKTKVEVWLDRHPAPAAAIGTLVLVTIVMVSTPWWRALMNSEWDWSLIWAAGAAFGQIVGAVAVVYSLRLMADQVREARNQVRLSTAQLAENSRQAEEARHSAVWPELILQPLNSSGHREDYVYTIFNAGVGPAMSVKFVCYDSDGIVSFTYPAHVVGPGKGYVVELSQHGDVDERNNLELRWQDVFGRQFEKRWVLYNSRGRPRTFHVDRDGGLGSLLI